MKFTSFTARDWDLVLFYAVPVIGFWLYGLWMVTRKDTRIRKAFQVCAFIFVTVIAFKWATEQAFDRGQSEPKPPATAVGN